VTRHPADVAAGGAARELEDRLVAAWSAGHGSGGEPVAGPGVVGLGIDAVDLDRFRTVLGRRPRLAQRMFTEDELAYAGGAPDPVPRLATRFATKEAVMKALGVGLWSFGLRDVEVVRRDLDAPTLVLHGPAADLAAAAGATRWHLSLTHTDTVALAAVVAERDDAVVADGGGR
jgi:holo-[acyl-carrier protein] synthase